MLFISCRIGWLAIFSEPTKPMQQNLKNMVFRNKSDIKEGGFGDETI
jgi:hypothetical protein